jgi:hypothetical protein
MHCALSVLCGSFCSERRCSSLHTKCAAAPLQTIQPPAVEQRYAGIAQPLMELHSRVQEAAAATPAAAAADQPNDAATEDAASPALPAGGSLLVVGGGVQTPCPALPTPCPLMHRMQQPGHPALTLFPTRTAKFTLVGQVHTGRASRPRPRPRPRPTPVARLHIADSEDSEADPTTERRAAAPSCTHASVATRRAAAHSHPRSSAAMLSKSIVTWHLLRGAQRAAAASGWVRRALGNARRAPPGGRTDPVGDSPHLGSRRAARPPSSRCPDTGTQRARHPQARSWASAAAEPAPEAYQAAEVSCRAQLAPVPPSGSPQLWGAAMQQPEPRTQVLHTHTLALHPAAVL